MAPPLFGRFQVVVCIAGGLRLAQTSAASRRMRRMGMHYRRGGVSSIASVLSLPRTPTGGCNACRAVPLAEGPTGRSVAVVSRYEARPR